MRLILLRHGMTEANRLRLYCGSTDLPLCDQGREALLCLRKTLVYPDASGLVKITSAMQRTDETLRLLYGCEPDVRMPAFREMNFGRFEMHSYDQLKFDDDYQAWIMDESGSVSTPGGESTSAFHRRIFAAVDNLQQDALLVCHGGVIAALMQRFFPGENRNMYQWQSSFGQGYELLLEDGNCRYVPIDAANLFKI